MKVYTVKMASRKGATEFKVLTAGEMVSSRFTLRGPERAGANAGASLHDLERNAWRPGGEGGSRQGVGVGEGWTPRVRVGGKGRPRAA